MNTTTHRLCEELYDIFLATNKWEIDMDGDILYIDVKTSDSSIKMELINALRGTQILHMDHAGNHIHIETRYRHTPELFHCLWKREEERLL